ncbi:hypothetical protein SAMN05444354_1254 [Stigmatella aurantiaca]|uniref:Uncharacterized protein n=1 Tax=Stigmatella aurantiaca TaxID=41 RepID=A0A1H8BZ75_STIAU|nr:hypothetical protein [Stigmatella aurantiaca]SEM88042.1 hypothetical protein SAMN05444354_1254 [Stigmatella aurantiaca]
MTAWMLIGLASLSTAAAEVQVSTATCTATITGPHFGLPPNGLMYFHFTTTCDVPVESMTVTGTITGTSGGSGSKTCTNTNTCRYTLGIHASSPGSWAWTNSTVYTGGTVSATGGMTWGSLVQSPTPF